MPVPVPVSGKIQAHVSVPIIAITTSASSGAVTAIPSSAGAGARFGAGKYHSTSAGAAARKK